MEEYLTTEELCNKLKLKKSYLRDLRYRGLIPFVKIGRLVRYQVSAIEHWVLKNKFSGMKYY